MGKGSGFLRETCPSVVAGLQCSSELEDEDMARKKGLSREHCSAWNRPHGQSSLRSCFPAYGNASFPLCCECGTLRIAFMLVASIC